MSYKFRKLIRHFWHDIYYFFASDRGVRFAMTCRDATEKIDLSDQAKTNLDKARVKLHVSLCQSCNNYYSFSQVLRRALKKLMKPDHKSVESLEKLNTDLVHKYSKK